jgi:F420-dependent oxidoreductase-like protein
MRFAFWPNANQSFEDVLDGAQHAERTGWDGLYFADHFMVPPMLDAPADTPTLECATVVTALAALVPRVRIGSLVYGNTYRHPAVLANMAATVDRVSGGRFILGVGAGWQENEHQQYGIPLPPPRERLDRLEEALRILHGLLRQPRTTVAGRYYQLTDAVCEPKPVQQPMPILVGGGGEKRTLPIVARYADVWNAWGYPEVIAHKSGVLNGYCEEAGRDPTSIARSTQAAILLNADPAEIAARAAGSPLPVIGGTPRQLADTMARYAEAGVDEFVVPDRTLGTGSRRRDAMDEFIRDVAGPFR